MTSPWKPSIKVFKAEQIQHLNINQHMHNKTQVGSQTLSFQVKTEWSAMKNRQKSHPLKKLRRKICLVCQQEYRTEANLEDFFNISYFLQQWLHQFIKSRSQFAGSQDFAYEDDKDRSASNPKSIIHGDTRVRISFILSIFEDSCSMRKKTL